MASDALLISHHKELEHQQMLLGYQVWEIVGLMGTAIVLGIVEFVNPRFFDFPYLQATNIGKIMNFWPLFVYAAVMAALSSRDILSSDHDESLLTLNTLTSILAGCWEEIGYRYIYVCTAMLFFMFCNMMSAFVLALFTGGLVGAIGVVMIGLASEQRRGFGRMLLVAVGVFVLLIGLYVGYKTFMGSNPVNWFFDYIMVPIVNLVTLGFFGSIFYGNYPRLLVYGMISANATFRDGHKYQGPVGYVNAWIAGFIMMYATLVHGLWTAVAIHVLYDLEFAFVRYAARKICGQKDQ